MTHVVTESCILCKHTNCVDVCPVDCFRETPFMLVIDPDECIDCAVCIPECPVNAIWAEEDVPAGQKSLIAVNQKLALIGTAITRRKSPLPNAEAWKEIPGKAVLVESDLTDGQVTNVDVKMDRLQHLSTAERLSPGEWTSAMNDSNPLIRLLVVARSDFSHERKRLDRALADLSDDVRRICIEKCGAELTKADVKTLLFDPSSGVRLALLRAKASTLTKDQVEHTLNDLESEIRLTVIQAPGFCPTDQQLFRGLERGNWVEVKAMLERMSKVQTALVLAHPSADVRSAAYGYTALALTPAQIQAGLQDPDEQVRRAVIDRDDVQLTPRQFVDIIGSGRLDIIDAASRKASTECVEEALNLADESLCARVIGQASTMTTDQVNRCIADPRSEVALTVLKKKGRKLTQGQVSIALQSTSPEVRRLAVDLYGVERLSAKHFSACLSDSDEMIRCLAVSCQLVEISENQMEQALVDRNLRVRSAAASRKDFLPNVLQFKRGQADKSNKIREIYSTRFALVKGKIVDVSKQNKFEPARQLKNILKEIAGIETWTSKKHQLKDELLVLLQKLDYVQFSVDARQAWLSQIGEHTVIDVPHNKRGHLQPMRGKKVHLVCVGHGSYSTIAFAAKAV